jgi:hypothetical protein
MSIMWFKSVEGIGAALLSLVAAAWLAAPAAWAQQDEPGVTEADVRLLAETLRDGPNSRSETTASLAGSGAGVIREIGTNAGRSTVRIGGAYVNFAPPAGHCFLDDMNARDKELTGVLRASFTGNLRLVGAYGECGQLDRWRRGERAGFDNYGMLLVPAGFIGKRLEGSAEGHVRAMCQALRGTVTTDLPAGGKALGRRIEAAMRQAEPGDLRFLGVAGEDGHACYAAYAQRRQGSAKMLLSIAAIGFASGKMIYSTLYGVQEGDRTLSELLARQRQAAERNAKR